MADTSLYQKSPKAPPAFQFYPGDFVAGTSRMTTTEVGGYLLLLCEQWLQGSIPGDNMKALSLIMRCTPSSAKSIWQAIQGKFVRGDDGQWRNARLEQVRSDQEAYRAKQSRNGALGGRKANANPTLKPEGKPNSNSSSLPPNKEREALTRPLSLRDRPIIQRRDFNAFMEGPIFNIPQKWADRTLAGSQGSLSERELREFGTAAMGRAERERVDFSSVHLLNWLDTALREWREQKAQARRNAAQDARGDAFLEEVAKMEAGQ